MREPGRAGSDGQAVSAPDGGGDHAAPAWRRRALRGLTLLLEGLGIALAGATVVLGLLFWRLSAGPLSLDGMAPYLEDALRPAGGAYAVRIDSAGFEWRGWSRFLDVAVTEVRVEDRDGRRLLAMPSAVLTVSAVDLLWGRITPVQVRLREPDLSLRRDGAGRWLVAAGGGEGAGGAPPGLPLADLFSPSAGPGFAQVDRLEIGAARITLRDAGSGLSVTADPADITLMPDAAGLKAEFGLTVAQPQSPLSLSGSLRYHLDDGLADGDVRIAGFRPAAWPLQQTMLAELARLGMPLTGDLAFAGSAAWGLEWLDAAFHTGAGTIALPELLPEPLAVDRSRMVARYAGDTGAVTISELMAEIDQSRLRATAELSPVEDGFRLALDGRVEQVPMARVKQLWPPELGAPARDWVVANLVNGGASTANLRLRARMGDLRGADFRLDALSGRIDFDGIDVHYLRPLPPVTGARGHATYDAQRFEIFVTEGQQEALRVDDATISFRRLDTDQQTGSFDLAVRGPLADALRLLDRPPLQFLQRLDVPTVAVAGQAGARIRFEIPMSRDIQPAQIGFGASADLREVVLPAAVGGLGLTARQLRLEVDGLGARLAGPVMFAGVPADLALEEVFNPADGIRRKTSLTGMLAAADAGRLGLPPIPGLDGTVGVDLDVVSRTDATARLTARLDLEQAGLRLPKIGLDKPPGRPGTAGLTIDFDGGRPADVPRFEIRATGLTLDAKASLAPGGGAVERITVSHLGFGDTLLSGTIDRVPAATGKQSYALVLAGRGLDLSRVIDGFGTGNTKDLPSFTVKAVLDSLRLDPDRLLTEVRATAAHDGRQLSELKLVARLDGTGIAGRLWRDSGRRWFELYADDASRLLAPVALFKTMTGGRLSAKGIVAERAGAETPGRAPIVADLTIDDFRMVDAPLLATIVNTASLPGLVDLFRGGGISFDRMTARVGLSEDRIEISDGFAYGHSIGLGIDGTVDRARSELSMTGMLVPAYALNRLIDRIPLLGSIITGGEKEGLLATQFFLTGDLDDPTVTVNPLTALTPGFLRGLIKAKDPSRAVIGSEDDGSANDR